MYSSHKHTSQIMLPEIFKTKERIRILRHINLRRSATVGAVALATGVSRGFCGRNARKASIRSAPRLSPTRTTPFST
ncbi:hypothetical protein E2N92_10465 [Methanofollis formosanus]|uniref:Uncharacterized protein n=1 Tax=Methanofollis formosanus TaxID=299308 RepID=A0A8G1A3L4_9EURY|nr:hypothetical protein [Methanofollis formosanus]QYZ79818.1 hypothetical protein E2N92_10465 [Methanofollis formosanus]